MESDRLWKDDSTAQYALGISHDGSLLFPASQGSSSTLTSSWVGQLYLAGFICFLATSLVPHSNDGMTVPRSASLSEEVIGHATFLINFTPHRQNRARATKKEALLST